MKHLFGLVLALTIHSAVLAQDVDKRLEKRYSNQELTKMQKEDPAHYKMLVYALDNACYTSEFPKDKASVLTQSIVLDPNKPLNFIDLGLEIKKENQYIKIEGTSKILVVKSEWVLNNELSKKQ